MILATLQLKSLCSLSIDFQIEGTELYRRLTLNEVLNLTLFFKDIKLSSTKLQAHASLDDYPEENICIGEGGEKKQHPNNSSRAWLFVCYPLQNKL